MVPFLLLLIAALILAMIGILVEGLVYLIAIACAVFVAALVVLGMGWGKRRARRPIR